MARLRSSSLALSFPGLRLLLLLLMPLGPALAQQADRTIHLWVDPRNGSDALAATYDPLPNSATRFCGSGFRVSHPLLELDPVTGLPLLHAAMPFRTVTGALQYLQLIQGPTGEAPFAPATGQYKAAYVIIHCLPGLYQDAHPTDPSYVDPHNGLKPNGETFPIKLPNRVAIQGTSALNTIFEPVTGKGPVFEFGYAPWNLGKAANDPGDLWSFIDSITISGVIRGPDANPPISAENQTAILVRGAEGQRVFLNVSNCFIYCNGIGVLADTFKPATGDPVESERSQINLIHNTFAWNVIGVWNGQLTAPIGAVWVLTGPLPSSKGFAHVSCVNNIFDSTPPCSGSPAGPGPRTLSLEVPMRNQMPSCTKSVPAGMARWAGLVSTTPVGWSGVLLPYVHGMSNFEGLDEFELWVGGPTNSRDTNAYEQTRFNRAVLFGVVDLSFALDRSTFLPNLPFTQTDFPTTIVNYPSTSAYNLTIITGGLAFQGSGPSASTPQDLLIRGALFVRDLMHLGGWAPGGPYFLDCDFDQAPTDFRLAPTAMQWYSSLDPVNRSMPPTGPMPNPMVDRGFPNQFETWPAPMFNGTSSPVILVPPLPRPALSSDSETPHDCEGHGNPRVVPGNGLTGAALVALPDIGADELDLNVLAGRRAGSDTFQQSAANPSIVRIENDYMFFLGPVFPGSTNPTPALVQPPDHTAWPPVPSFLVSPPVPVALYIPLYVDTVPHLLPDAHPFHFFFFPLPNLFPTNWVWETCAPPINGQPIVNTSLFMDPLVGVANPTGSAQLLTDPAYRWLDYLQPNNPFQLTKWGQVPPVPPAVFYNSKLKGFGLWCEHVTDPNDPLVLVSPQRPSQHPYISGASSGNNTAMRVSLEFGYGNAPTGTIDANGTFSPVSRFSNLQTFLVVKP